ncbi:MAG: 50S ribosomal protein L5 [Candidatus Diapherotrites archaeon]|nr:50S ribosomal protein L5 [Candidatus Diapherotrites archaeon]
MIKVSKVTVNIGVGSSGEELEKAEKLLQILCNQKPVRTLSAKRVPEWGIRKAQPIGVKVTLRGEKAIEFLDKALAAKERVLKESQFDQNGNFAFGVKEYIELPGVKYDPSIGIFGFDVCVTVEKNGYRIKRRKRQKAKIPNKHKLSKEESIKWAKENFKIDVKVGE